MTHRSIGGSQYHNSAVKPLPLSPRHLIRHSKLSLLAANEHKTHNEWLRKIRTLWDSMFSLSTYDEIGRVEQELREGQRKLKLLKLENMRQNAQVLDIE